MVTEQFLRAAAENGMVVHGPFAADQAARVAVETTVARAGGEPVAVPVADPLVEALGLRDALAWAGLDLLPANDVAWRDEIGTLLLPCGEGRPRGTHIVPPAHVCVVRAADLVATIEDAIRLQAAEPHPSNLSWVSGPSRTADLEMRQTIGVHGPKSVDVIVVE